MAENTVVLVSPDGDRKRTVQVNSKDETALRWDGWQTAPEEAPQPEAPKAVARRSEQSGSPSTTA